MLIDSHGRLFGRFNLVDVAAALFVIVLVPMSVVAYRVFRIPPPEILSVTPATLVADAPRRLRLTGRHFRPYLGAFAAKTGEPFSSRTPVETMQATFLVETPNEVEIALPPLGPGTYDIHLYDTAREVASRQAAFTIAPLKSATIDALIRFVVPPETASLAQEGDRDRGQQAANNALSPSELATMGAPRALKEAVTFISPRAQMPGVAFEAVVHIPAKTRVLGGWEYKGEWLRAGETFVFETDGYKIFGVIERMTEVSPTATAPGGK
jgi:hypothetical protein